MAISLQNLWEKCQSRSHGWSWNLRIIGGYPSAVSAGYLRGSSCSADAGGSGDKVETPIWDEYTEIIKRVDVRGSSAISNIERFKFYDEAREAYAIIATGEGALYANIMLQKGVVV